MKERKEGRKKKINCNVADQLFLRGRDLLEI